MTSHRHLQSLHAVCSPVAVTAITTLIAIAISVGSLWSGRVIIFQNVFYVPIVLACMYYVRKGFAFSVVLSFVYLFLVIVLTGDLTVILQALVRTFIFVAVAGVTTFLSAKRRQAEEKLQVHERQLKTLASELALAEERERRRIAGELHDHTCQSLVLARTKLDELVKSLSDGQAEALRNISSILNETIEGVRGLTFDLSSPTLYRFGVEAALEELLDDMFRLQKDVEYCFRDDLQPKPLTDDVRVMLFQSVREILINIVKHARARRIDLDIRRQDSSIRITVTDDGVGFDVDGVLSLPARHGGFGLFNIQERLDYIGGLLEITSQIGEGSRLVLVAPLNVECLDSRRNHDVGQNSAC